MSNATNAKRNTKTRAFPIVLKTLHDDIVRATNNETLTTKAMRVKLRAKCNDIHEHNNAWTFNNQREYDRARSLFDAKYASSLTRTMTRKPRAKKNDATTNVDANATTTNVDA